ncbi:AraC family transcriptional regulator [Desertivirga arenae]|uniref:AraC family transcriptional regulator n=1 Tax=Desertivirga arenae TaxID=2810309 RepID=UPI001A972BBD|nr:AraC family transcriptional regulator [Pedobacter sp. SYSU D00823]
MQLIQEVTPFKNGDCFAVFSGSKSTISVPAHSHPTYELHLLLNAGGARRVVEGREETITDFDMVLLGPDLMHGWTGKACNSVEIIEVSVQWPADLFADKFLQRSQMNYLKAMLNKSFQGIAFSKDSILNVLPRMLALKGKSGFVAFAEIMGILNELSLAKGYRTVLHDDDESGCNSNYTSRIIENALELMNCCFEQQISLSNMASMANMTEEGFCRFIKKHTGCTFTESLTKIRLSQASRMLIETSQPIATISSACGFRNLSNFNRIFKRKNGCTPREYRRGFQTKMQFI